jgi:hypothetical protein
MVIRILIQVNKEKKSKTHKKTKKTIIKVMVCLLSTCKKKFATKYVH